MKSVTIIFSLLFGVCVANAAIDSGHPRLINNTQWSYLSTWATDDTWQPWTKFIDEYLGETLSASPDSTGEVRIALAKAIAWKVGQDDECTSGSCRTDLLNVWDNLITNLDTREVDGRGVYFAYLYDIMYSELAESQRREAIDKFVDMLDNRVQATNYSVFWNYRDEWAKYMSLAIAGAGDDANVTNDLEAEYNDLMTKYFAPHLYYAERLLDGYMVEGNRYGLIANSRVFVQLSDMLYNADSNYATLYTSNAWYRKRLTYLWQSYGIPLKYTDPYESDRPAWLYLPWDHTVHQRANTTQFARAEMLVLLTRLPLHEHHDQIVKHLYDSGDPEMNKFVSSPVGDEYIWAFLFGNKDAAQSEQALRFWTTGKHSSGTYDPANDADYDYGPGFVFMRSGYTAEDIYLVFKAGDIFAVNGHGCLADGTFQLFAKGEMLAIHSAAYDGSGDVEQGYNYFSRTVATNGLIIYDADEKFFVKGEDADNDGGQRDFLGSPHMNTSDGVHAESAFIQWRDDLTEPGDYGRDDNPDGGNHRGELLRTGHVDDQYSYAYADITRAYNSDEVVDGSSEGNTAKVALVVREISMLYNKYVVIHDIITKKEATSCTGSEAEGEPCDNQDKWLLHSQELFSVNGTESAPSAGERVYTEPDGSFYTDINTFGNGARLMGQVVLPSSNYLIRRFYGTTDDADKRYWNYQQNVAYDSVQHSWALVQYGKDRIEIEPTDTGLTHNYLAVLYPGETTDVMPTITEIDATHFEGVTIEDATQPQVIIFADDGATHDRASYTASYSGTGRHVVTGLSAGHYDVTVGGSPVVTGRSVDADSDLTFTSTSGVVVISNNGQVNQAPIAINDTAATDLNTAVTIDVIANDQDAEGDPLTIESCSALSANGGTIVQQDGTTVTFTPATDFSGTDTFTYVATDSQETSESATVTVTVEVPGSGGGSGSGGSSGGCFVAVEFGSIL